MNGRRPGLHRRAASNASYYENDRVVLCMRLTVLYCTIVDVPCLRNTCRTLPADSRRCTNSYISAATHVRCVRPDDRTTVIDRVDRLLSLPGRDAGETTFTCKTQTVFTRDSYRLSVRHTLERYQNGPS